MLQRLDRRLQRCFAAYERLDMFRLDGSIESWHHRRSPVHLLSLMMRSEERRGARVPKLITGLVYGAMLLLASALFMRQQGYSFAGVWVSTGDAAAVLGLALQKTLGDLFSDIALGVE